MDFVNYIINDALILIPVLLVIGRVLKGMEVIPDKWIPLILLPFGVAGSLAMIGFTVDAAVQGVLVTGASVYSNQVVKQLGKDE